MRINFEKLIQDYNAKNPKANLNKSKLAREFVKAELFTSEVSALNMMRINDAGKAKTFTKSLIIFLCDRFDKKGSEIIEWNDEVKTISDVAPKIRNDAPGLKNKIKT